ncbi:hypothetical protein [Gemmatimonas sp.]|uniref:hypothetical protein n=1 Tax=Gemmatimonas sp. TaxID=1962908 RepID=UPI0037BE51CA
MNDDPLMATGEQINSPLLDPFAAVEFWATTKLPVIGRPVTPLYKDGPRHPVAIGSGLIIRAGEHLIIATAAHVADDLHGQPAYFSANEELHPLPSILFRSPLPPSGQREHDQVDLAFWVLEPTRHALVPSADSVPISRLERSPCADAQAFYLVMGYPASRQPRRMLSAQEYAAKTFPFITSECGDADYASAALDRTSSLFLRYRKDDTFVRQVRQEGPDLFGVSGGPVFRISGEPNARIFEPPIAAFAIAWRKGNPLGLVTTRSSVLVDALARELPLITAALR